MSKQPGSYLPPQSQPWGRWVESQLQEINNERIRNDVDIRNSLRQLNLSLFQPMRGMLWRQTTGTVSITTAGVYVPINLAGTLDADVSFNMDESGSPNVTGLKNITEQTRTVFVLATYDGKGGNNHAIGLKLALNGTPLDSTECRSFGGASGQVGKTLTQWIMKLEPGDEVTMLAANIDATDNLTIDRFKMAAHAIS